MDRREALKKLGAGGALVIASPAILPSVRVAHAASPAETGLSGVPEAGQPIPWTEVPAPDNRNKRRQVAIAPDMSGVTCADGSAPIITYEWRIVSVSWKPSNKVYQLRVVEATGNRQDPAGAQLTITPPSKTGYNGPTAYSPASYATGGFLIRKLGSAGDVNFHPNDVWAAEMRVRWHCDTATSDLEAEYLFNGSGSDASAVTNTTWNILPA